MHPHYNSILIRNDIGLIKLNKDIVFGEKVKPIVLPTENFDKSNYSATLAGWGTNNVNIKKLVHRYVLRDIKILYV